MGVWVTTAIIAGVDLSACRVELLDAEKFLSNYVGSTTWSNSGDANAQMVNVGVKGNVFRVRILSAETEDILEIAQDIETAVAALSTFQVTIIDAMMNLDLMCNRIFGQTPWIKYGKNREGWVEDITFTFVSRSVAP